MSARLKQYLCLNDFERAARRRLPRPLFGYIAGASETNASLRYNAEDFDAYAFRPQVLRDVSARSTQTTLFGETYDAPFGIAPMGISALMAYRGDIALAEAARECRIPMIMSGSSLIRLEDVAAVAPASWFQAYLPCAASPSSHPVSRATSGGETTSTGSTLSAYARAGLESL